jgi:hypothetical protein
MIDLIETLDQLVSQLQVLHLVELDELVLEYLMQIAVDQKIKIQTLI